MKVPSSAEARENGSKGGKKSGETRRKVKLMKDVAMKILTSQLTKEDAEKLKRFKGLNSGDMNYMSAMIARQMAKALQGDLNSAKWMQELIGQKESDKLELTGKDGEALCTGFTIEVIDKREQVRTTDEDG